MAIRIERGTAPQYGRVTMPKGTFLSNPATAADGSLGGPQGMNPAPGWTGNLGYGTPQVGFNWANVPIIGQIIRGSQSNGPLQVTGGPRPGGPTAPVVQTDPLNTIRRALGMQYQTTTVPPASQIGQSNPYVSPFANQAGQVQKGVEWQPGGLPSGVVSNSAAMQAGALDGLNNAQVAQQMMQNGYTQKWVEGVGMTWFPSSAVSQKFGNAAGNNNGRPDWVDGASLAPGESVTDANGNRYVGGTPAPDGTAQYAVNYANPNAAKDTKGKYKWVSEVRKDNNGNWVRVNKQVLRKVYTRSHLKKQQGRAEQAAIEQQQPQSTEPQAANYNQLVNLRVNYG